MLGLYGEQLAAAVGIASSRTGGVLANVVSDQDIAWAKRVVAAFENATTGTIGPDAQMLDMPHLKQAKRVLEVAQQTAPSA